MKVAIHRGAILKGGAALMGAAALPASLWPRSSGSAWVPAASASPDVALDTALRVPNEDQAERRSEMARRLMALTFAALAASLLMVVAGSEASPNRCGDVVLGDGPELDCPSAEASVTGGIARLHQVDPHCPPPTVPRGSQCVLDSDVVLGDTLDLASFTHLNCRGHRLTPAIRGVSDNPVTPGDEFAPSEPQAAIVLHQAFGVMVQNCVLDGFDFGVFVVDGKASPQLRNDPGALAQLRNRFRGNTITSRFLAMSVIKADNNEIKDNWIDMGLSGCADGIHVVRDSDLNVIKNNTIVSGANAPGPFAEFPGGPVEVCFFQTGIQEFNVARGETLFNIRLGADLIQAPYSEGDVPEGNILEGNRLDLPPNASGHATGGIVVGAQHRGALVRENDVRTSFAVLVSGGLTQDVTIPGTCSLDPVRRCLSDDHCLIPGIDAASKGACSGVSTKVVDLRSRDTVIEGNTVTMTGAASLDGVALVATYDPVVWGNYVTGAGRAGVALADKALETAVVSHNVITGNSHGLFLGNPFEARFHRAEVSLNDVTASSTRAILRRSNYVFPTELSVAGRGNFWGRSCADDDGFIEADKPGADSPAPSIVDSHPYGVPVGNT